MGCNFTLTVVLYLISGKTQGILLGVSFGDANAAGQTGSGDVSWRKQEVVRVLVRSTNQTLFKNGEINLFFKYVFLFIGQHTKFLFYIFSNAHICKDVSVRLVQ